MADKQRKEATKIADEVADWLTQRMALWTFSGSHTKSNLIYLTRFQIEAKITALLESIKEDDAPLETT